MWEVTEQRRDLAGGDSCRPVPLVSHRLYLLTLAPRHLGTLTWIPLSHISLPVTDATFLNDGTIFSFLILQSFKCGGVFLVLFWFVFFPGGIFRHRLTSVILVSLKAEIDIQILKLELFRKGCQSSDAVVYSQSLCSTVCYFHDKFCIFMHTFFKWRKF